MPKVLIADDVGDECARILRKAEIEVDFKGKMKPEDLKAAIPNYEGLVVRSAAKVTKEIIDAGTKLKIVGRAGIGVDNIDQDAATKRGVIVMNSPQGNMASAAEHTWGLLMAMCRNIAQADASMRASKWERSKYQGVELETKTLGIVGLGKIGGLLSQYAKPFRMRVIAFDPVVTKERAAGLGVELVDMDRLLAESDFITFHVPLTDKTRGMIGAPQFKKMKRTVRLINTSRGGVIDEKALADALTAKDIAGAALDVYETEPPAKDHPLLKVENCTLTPHLAASTEEAQVKVAIDIAEQFVDYFKNGVVRNSTNLAGLADPSLTPYLRLAEDLGGLAAQLAGGRVKSVTATYQGVIAGFEVGAITQSALKGALHPTVGEGVNVINSRFVAKEAGIQVQEEKQKDARNYKSLVSIKVEAEKGTRTVSGAVFEGRDSRIVEIDTMDIDLRPAKHMVVLAYVDQPGIVGKVGTILGQNNINIARMEVGRAGRGQQAMILLSVDDPVKVEVLEEIRKAIAAHDVRSVTLP
ncbi:MAG TPA: phosphoglycerate dehydrogenase [Planctomycetota bacterium]|nr:phosphoglycerate dehydrogenase [Planctomycetota bacterium]